MRIFTKTSLSFNFAVVPTIFILCSCSAQNQKQIVGGPCTSQSFPGTATVTEIIVKTNGSEAHFKFSPTDPNVISQYHIPSKDDNIILTRDGLGLPTSEWLTSQSITVGAEFQAIRHEIRTGTCTPLMFTFPSIPGCSAQ